MKHYRLIYQVKDDDGSGTGHATIRVNYDPFTTEALTKIENEIINKSNAENKVQIHHLFITNIIPLND